MSSAKVISENSFVNQEIAVDVDLEKINTLQQGGRGFLTISVRQAGVAAHCTVTLEDGRPLDRHASGDRNVKF